MNISATQSSQEIARLSARMLLEIKAVHFNAADPFTLASGLPSPTYIDCRKVISFPRVRNALMDFMCQTLTRDAGFEAFDNIAGGETAGIPFAAVVAARPEPRVRAPRRLRRLLPERAPRRRLRRARHRAPQA